MPFGFGRGKGRWGKGFRGGKVREGSGSGRFPFECICPHCGLIEPHKPGIPCFQKKCTRCGSPMARKFPPLE